MTADEAIQIATKHFPDGLAKIAEALQIQVHYCKLSVDGWCVRNQDGSALVRVSSTKATVRQRFTLAHEIAHLILGTFTDVLRDFDPFDPKQPEEQAANYLASQLLLPQPSIRSLTQERLVDRKTIRYVAKKAGVSEVVAALRYVKLHDSFGLKNATVVHFQKGKCRWKLPKSRQLESSWAFELYSRACSSAGRVTLVEGPDGFVMACALCGQDYPVLFYHELTTEQASHYRLASPSERRRKLEEHLFGGDAPFQRKLNGMIGGFRNQAQGMTYVDAVGVFLDRYSVRECWNTDEQHEKMWSQECHEYIWLRLAEYSQEEGD
jgi:Zn-dependent peptidase ImmA (M78 family)